MSGNFYMVDTYTPNLFSTDTRNFAFSLLDAVSKVLVNENIQILMQHMKRKLGYFPFLRKYSERLTPLFLKEQSFH